MPDEQISYLEPIDDNDLGFGKKLGQEGMKSGQSEASVETPAEAEKASEQQSETATEKEQVYQKILAVTKASPVPSDNQSVADDAQAVSLQTDADSQVQQLVDLVMIKGVAHAVKVTQKLNDFYVLDRLHDELVNRFYEALVEKGLVDKE